MTISIKGYREPVLPTNGVLPNEQPKLANRYNLVKRLRFFNSIEDAAVGANFARAVYAREFNHAVDRSAEDFLRNSIDFDLTNAATEGTGAGGGYTVPAPVSTQMIRVLETVGVVRRVCDIQPMAADTQSIPKRSTGLTVYAPGEGNPITPSDVYFQSVMAISKKCAVASQLSNELNDDSVLNLVDDLFMEMAYSLGLQEDNELINGTGAATTYFGVTGLLSSIGTAGVSQAASGHDTWPELDIADFAACIGKLPDRYHDYGPAWICSHSFFNSTMARLAYSAGGATMSEILSARRTRDRSWATLFF